MPGFADRFLSTGYKTTPDEIGKQESEFYKVAWKQAIQIQPKPGEFLRNELSNIYGVKELTRLLRLDKLAKRLDDGSNPYYSFDGKTLVDINNAVAGNPFADVHWRADVKAGIQPPGVTTQEPLGRVRLENVRIAEKHGSMFHEHKVLDSVDFQDVIVVFGFKGSNQKLNMYLDHSSPNYISGMRAQTVNRYAGSDGNKGSDKMYPKYQLGLSQNHLYGFKCGNLLIGVWVRYSFVFGYPKNDFEPGGIINACKCFPQITFSHFVQDIRTIPASFNWQTLFPYVQDITSLRPTGTTAESIYVERYKSRVKMVVSVNSSHHVSPQTINGVMYDGNYLGDLRATDVNSIPRQFEKILDPTYYGANNTRNILGFYTDSNNTDNATGRIRGPYLGPAGIEIPCWFNIFDYGNYDVQNAMQFIAIHGPQTPKTSKVANGKFQSIKTAVTYPSVATPNRYRVSKFPRQGAYDNIHLHGYLGHYLNEDGTTGPLVAHAPICGYCCFHLHWRWSPVNVKVANGPVKNGLVGKGFNNSDNFKGWSNTTANAVEGRALVPPNQHINLAVTTASPSFSPVTEDGNILSQTSSSPTSWNGNVLTSTAALDTDKKCIWYCCDILERGPEQTHVVMEQGCGYAFNYYKPVAWNITKTQVHAVVLQYSIITALYDYFGYIIDLFNYGNFTDFRDAIVPFNLPYTDPRVEDVMSWRFEMQYRLMHLFNRAEIALTASDYTAHPMRYVNDYENVTNYNKNYQLNGLDQIPTRISDPVILATLSNL